jgi:CubicO group peptidase (beta-lactamase class C family)
MPAKMHDSLNSMLTPYLAKYGLPAVGAAVVKDGRVIAIGAVGTRRLGESIPVTTSDRFHLGSDTKATTALLAAMYVEQGKLRWDSTVGEVFPEFKGSASPAMAAITLTQLLSHTSGMPGDDDFFGGLIKDSFMRENDDLRDIRYWMVSKWVARSFDAKAPRQFSYSNMGFLMAGAMIEKVAGKSWEELVTERVFTPLKLRSAGLGPQSTMGRVDAPLPHKIVDGRAKPMLAGPNADNPLLLGPAGTAHMSLEDFAAWAGWNAGQGKRGPALIKPETFVKLTTPVIEVAPEKGTPPGTPPRGRYALGWGEARNKWSSEPILTHAGSNTMNLCHIYLQPKYDFAMVIMTNIGGEKADVGFRALAAEIYDLYGPAKK